MEKPLAEKIRPNELNDFIGQSHLVGLPDPETGVNVGPLRQAIEKGEYMSFILWGPPGVGKTTLARIYARALGESIVELSAVSAGKEDIRKIIKSEKAEGGRRILFLDEMHRFNKAQQDFLLPYVETGELILIGATTENPSFEIIGPLLSRLKVFVLNPLSASEVATILRRSGFQLESDVLDHLINLSGGDARRALGFLESAYQLYGKITIEILSEVSQIKILDHDRNGDKHYDLISAYIKSLRAGQPDAALYYLARMVESGEDPKFIARRMIIFASEDIGLAQPTALVLANEIFRAVEVVGLPEAKINLAHGTAYLARARKDRSSYNAYNLAAADVEKYGLLPIPLKVRNAPTSLLKDLGYGKDYELYPEEDLRPDKLQNKKYLL